MRIEEERFCPENFMPPWVRYQHLQRYRWAAEFVVGKQVLDMACGSGYGSAMLASAGATHVSGFDRSAATVVSARRAWPALNLEFDVADADYLPVPDSSFDVYVSFETIEHVDDDEVLLAEATCVLRPGGLLLVSTPNRDLLDPGITIHDRPFNRYHTREYRHAEFEERLSRHFATVTWYGQRPFSPDYVAWLGRVGRRWPALAVKLHQARKCLGWPWESPERHRPCPCNGDLGFNEVLIAACQTASTPDTGGIP